MMNKGSVPFSLSWLVLAGLLLPAAQVTAGEIELLVPAYGNPCCGTGMSMWNTLISTAQNANTNNIPLHLNVIFNPASGPGLTADPNYYNPSNPSVGHQLVHLRNAGGSHVTIYGYVATNFGDFIGKPLSVIKDEIDRYQTLYPNLVDGIFLDEMSNLPSKVADYHTIYVHIKNDTPPSSYKGGPVIGNPGTQTNEAYLLPATQAADTLVNFENTGNEYLTNYSAPLWVNNYPPDRFAHLIHTQSSWSTNFLALADQRNAGMIYVTDDAFPNPWDALTGYWTDEVSAIEAGLQSPTADAQVTSSAGDNNGFESNPANAHANDGVFAVDTNSGTGSSTSCTSSKKDKHLFYNYNFSIPAGSTIKGIEVRLDAKVDSTLGSPKLCVQLSSDGGATWTTAKSTPRLTTSEATYVLGSPSDLWGRTWAVGEFNSNTSFRVRVISVASSTSRDFSLDWVAVRVYQQ